MQKRDAYPADTVTGSCFITGDYDPSEGVVDLDINLDVLPPWGRLCVSPKAVRMLVTTLGLQWPDADVTARNVELDSEVTKLREENRRMRAAFARIVDASKLAQVQDWVAT